NELDSAGGVFEVVAIGVPPGLGSHVHWNRRLDGAIAQAMMSIHAMKGVGFGIGFDAAGLRGSQVHDEIFWSEERGIYRETNRLGGMEGGMTNGEPVVVRVAMKPIPTLRKPLRSIDLATLEPFGASRERSDTTAIGAAPVIGEAMLALMLADAVLDKFGGDSLAEIQRHYQGYLAELGERGWRPARWAGS
ncbi:MAG: chorismate synthase, partial [Thermaerobacterales bacterium]